MRREEGEIAAKGGRDSLLREDDEREREEKSEVRRASCGSRPTAL